MSGMCRLIRIVGMAILLFLTGSAGSRPAHPNQQTTWP